MTKKVDNKPAVKKTNGVLAQMITEIQNSRDPRMTNVDIAEIVEITPTYLSRALGNERKGIAPPSKLLRNIKAKFELALTGTRTLTGTAEELLSDQKEEITGLRIWVEILLDELIRLMMDKDPKLKPKEEKRRLAALQRDRAVQRLDEW